MRLRTAARTLRIRQSSVDVQRVIVKLLLRVNEATPLLVPLTTTLYVSASVPFAVLPATVPENASATSNASRIAPLLHCSPYAFAAWQLVALNENELLPAVPV